MSMAAIGSTTAKAAVRTDTPWGTENVKIDKF